MIAIVTDSTAYLTQREAQQMGVRLVPISYTVNSRSYNETYADKNGNFERIIALSGGDCQVTTSQTTLPVFMATFEELIRKGYEVLCITLSSRLSGTYSNASVAARNLGGEHIHILDSMLAAGGTYLLIQAAAEMIRQERSMGEIIDRLMKLRERIGIVFSVSDMGPLRRSGRLGIVRQSVGTVLNIRPILKVYEGCVVSDGIARGRHDQMRRMIARVPQQVERLIVHEIGGGTASQALQERLRQQYPGVPVQRRSVGPVLGIHLGMDVIGIVWEQKDSL